MGEGMGEGEVVGGWGRGMGGVGGWGRGMGGWVDGGGGGGWGRRIVGTLQNMGSTLQPLSPESRAFTTPRPVSLNEKRFTQENNHCTNCVQYQGFQSPLGPFKSLEIEGFGKKRSGEWAKSRKG